MKTYQTKPKDEKRKNFFKRHMYAFIIAFSCIVVALAVTLTLVFSLPDSAPVGGTDVEEPVDPTPPVVETVVLPVEGASIGLEYSKDKLVKWETLKQYRTHEAVDFIAAEGTKVVAVFSGKVTAVQDTTLDGMTVKIEHENGYTSVYKSLSETVNVKTGDSVKGGDQIGTVSNTMMTESLTGAHLHFELYKDGKTVDPAVWLPMGK